MRTNCLYPFFRFGKVSPFGLRNKKNNPRNNSEICIVNQTNMPSEAVENGSQRSLTL